MKKAARQLPSVHGVDAVLLTHVPTIGWACGFTGSHAALIVLPEKVHFITDARYTQQAEEEARGTVRHTAPEDLYAYARRAGLLKRASRVLFQADHTSVAIHQRWQHLWPHMEWVPVEKLLARDMAIRTSKELAHMRRAQRITDDVFMRILDCIRPGVTEQELAAEIISHLMMEGAQGLAFDPIVASGPLAARPHARPTKKELQSEEIVLLDFGCTVQGYASDMTRTVAIDDPGWRARDAYAVVLEAQQRAMDAVRPGVAARDLDVAARDCICEGGYEEYLAHSLGHGIGRQVHEWPRLSLRSGDVLQQNMTVTLEPGVYLPYQFGIRIEDTVVVTGDGCRRLGNAPRDLYIV